MFAGFIAKCFSFLFIFGSVVDDVGGFAAMIGLSIALNHGVMRPKALPKAKPVAVKPQLAFPAGPALQR
jgi:hypothetical protein